MGALKWGNSPPEKNWEITCQKNFKIQISNFFCQFFLLLQCLPPVPIKNSKNVTI